MKNQNDSATNGEGSLLLSARVKALEDSAMQLKRIHAEVGDDLPRVSILLGQPAYGRLLAALRDADAGRSTLNTLVMERVAPEAFAAARARFRDPTREDFLKLTFKERCTRTLLFLVQNQRAPSRDADNYAERAYARWLGMLPNGWRLPQGGQATVGSQLHRIVDLARSSYHKERQLAALDAQRLLREIEPLQGVSIWDACQLQDGPQRGETLVRDMTRLKVQALPMERIAERLGVGFHTVREKTADLTSRVRPRASTEEKALVQQQVPVFDAESRALLLEMFAGGHRPFIDRLIAVNDCVSLQKNRVCAVSADIAKLQSAMGWLRDYIGVEMDEFWIRVEARTKQPGLAGLAREAARQLQIPDGQIAEPFITRNVNRPCYATPGGFAYQLLFSNVAKQAFLQAIMTRVADLEMRTRGWGRRYFAEWASARRTHKAVKALLA